jgi:2-hydroxymuconate-semialdehyde hydrolase
MEIVTTKVQNGSHSTNLYRTGTGKQPTILFLHGSGPGATAFSNWQYALPALANVYDCLAPDLQGFGDSDPPTPLPVGVRSWMRVWTDQILHLMDYLNIAKAHLVGNSLGGAIALHLLIAAPDRFERVVLMGSVGVPCQLTPELNRIWGFYTDPSVAAMAQIISWFAYDENFIKNQLQQIAHMRYEAAMRPHIRRSFEAMFPAPRQQQLDDLVIPDSALRRIHHPVLLVHGRNDGIVPVETSYYLLERLATAQLHVYSRCSHWIQIEFRESFHQLLLDFFSAKL